VEPQGHGLFPPQALATPHAARKLVSLAGWLRRSCPVLPFKHRHLTIYGVTVDSFKPEIAEALRAFERYVVCIEKTPEECESSLVSLMEKAIKAYQNRGPNLRHGIALDKQVTIILSQTETDKPLCGIYFNLSSPYHKKNGARTAGKLD
jgi:hypothetical protein